MQSHYIGFYLSSYGNCLTKWNKLIKVMYAQCMEVGKDKCLLVYYKQLMLQSRSSLKLILDHLGVTWSNTVLHHQDLTGKWGGISLFTIQWSTDKVKPVNLEVLSKWTHHISGDMVPDMAQIVPCWLSLATTPMQTPAPTPHFHYSNPDPHRHL